jgi:hypothetical protein
MYLGLCFTDAYIELIKRQLAATVVGKYTTEGLPLYQPSLAQLIHGLCGKLTTETETQVIRASSRGRGRSGGRGRHGLGSGRGGHESKAGEKDQLAGKESKDTMKAWASPASAGQARPCQTASSESMVSR